MSHPAAPRGPEFKGGPEFEKATHLISYSTLCVNILSPKEIKLIKLHILCELSFRRPRNGDLQGH